MRTSLLAPDPRRTPPEPSPLTRRATAGAPATSPVADPVTDPAPEVPALPPARPVRATALFVVLVGALAVIAVVAAGSGQLDIPPSEVIGSLLHRLGIDAGTLPSHPNGEAALWTIRFPRVAMALLVGASLGAAGALMQGVFRNPLAEPGVVGVSSGAALAAAAAIVVGLDFLGPWTVAAMAFVGGLLATLLVYGLSRSAGQTQVVTLVLTGVAVNACTGAGIAFLTFLGDTQSREQIVFWQLGSLNGTRWPYVVVVVAMAGVGLTVAFAISRQLDLLALGERAARHLGVHVERLRLTAVVVVALLTAAAVAFCGIIGFVGLVVPHLIRMAVGPGHRVLVPASALGGAVLLLSADLVARTAITYADLPIGMLTSLVGGPFFFWLLRRSRQRSGAWG